MLLTLQARQRVRESQDRERWRGGEGVENCMGCNEDSSAAEGTVNTTSIMRGGSVALTKCIL